MKKTLLQVITKMTLEKAQEIKLQRLKQQKSHSLDMHLRKKCVFKHSF